MISQPIYYPPVGPGTLRITPYQANIRPSIIPFNKLKLFCRVKLGVVYQDTNTDAIHNNNPTWSQELVFKRTTEDSVKIELRHKTILTTTEVVGMCTVKLQNVFAQRQLKVMETLYGMKEGEIGGIKLLLKWEPDVDTQNFFQVGAPFSVNAALAQSYYAPNTNMPQRIIIPQNMLQSGGNIIIPVPNNTGTVMPPQNPGLPQVSNFVVGTPGYQPYPPNSQTSYNTQNINYGSPTQQQPYAVPCSQGGVMSPLGSPQQMYGQQPGYQGTTHPVKGMAVMGLNMDPVLQNPEEEKEMEEEIVGDDVPEEQRCIVCMEKKKSGAFYKCGHNCCCMGCGKKFKGKACPICREPVYDIIKVFNS